MAEKDQQAERLAAALRENLKKRKTQERQRQAGEVGATLLDKKAMTGSHEFPGQVRWRQRLQNFGAALATLREALAATQHAPQDHLYRIALIGAFKFTFELGWKTLRDYLQFSGVEATLPRDVIKQAFQNGLVADGQLWITMMLDRNLLSHAYDDAAALLAAGSIGSTYLDAIEQVYAMLKSKEAAV